MRERPHLLIVGKITNIAALTTKTRTDYEILFAADLKEAIAKLRRFEPAVVLLEAALGLEILNEILSLSQNTKIIVISTSDERKLAIEAIAQGAYDYFVNPLACPALEQVINRAFYIHELAKEVNGLSFFSKSPIINGIVMGSVPMQKVCHTIEKVAPSNISILLQGESGTGKEVLARAIHEKSERAKGPFVAINCAAIPETLLESELFGYERGAFTGAHKLTLGKIERAHNGTLFLDEIGDLPLALQPKLLRFLQERVIERLGGSAPQPVDVRIICATHQQLALQIQKQTFREDLYYRLSEVTISIPPLRERGRDPVVMARIFLKKYAEEYKKPLRRIAENALQAIQQYAWPGNVRELENRLKRAVVLADGQQITLEDLDLPHPQQNHHPFNLKQVRDKAERESILSAMHYCEGNISKAAELLGITRPTLYNMMEKLHLNEQAIC